jgi:hypothetical protein
LKWGGIFKVMARGQAVTKGEVVEILQTEMGKILLDFHEKVFKKDMVKMMMDFHREVQEPMMDEVLNRLSGVEKRLDEVNVELKNEIGRLERKLDKVTDHQAEELDDHEGRIIRLEAIA